MTANWGFHALAANVNNYSEALSTVVTSGTAVVLTPANVTAGIVNLTAGASGGFTITLPTTANILSALGNTVATDGSYAEPISFMNNGVGQTGTVTAGDASTTITGTATVATNTVRKYLMTVTGPTTITLTNVGSMTL